MNRCYLRQLGRKLLVTNMVLFSLTCGTAMCAYGAPEDAKPEEANSQNTPAAEQQQPDEAELHAAFTKLLTDAKLIGHFTIIGKDGPPAREEYAIQSVEKLAEGDFWMFKARIKYGERDVTVPLPLKVKWAGDTPVITLTDFTIPGLGTFSARVVIYNQKYAGTWTHGEVGGHLYGVIEHP